METKTGVLHRSFDRLTWLLVVAAVVDGAFVFYAWAEQIPGVDRAPAILAIVFVAALISSVAGFAFSALAGAGLGHLAITPTEAVATMLVCSIAIQSYAVFSLRCAIEWRRLMPFLCGGVVTLPLGITLLARVSPATFSLCLGALLALYGLYMLMRKPDIVLKGNVLSDIAIGATGGLTGGLAAFPGAFVAVWCGMRGWSKEAQRGVFQPYILIMQVFALVLLESRVAIPQSRYWAFALVPIVILAAHLGIAVFRKLSNRQFNSAVHVLLTIAGLMLAAKFA